MSDLDVMIAELRPEVALPTEVELRPARQLLLYAIEAEVVSNDGSSLERRSPATVGRRRLILAGVASIAAAATAVGFLMSRGPNLPSGSRPTINLAAARFLDQAADAALQQRGDVPAANQFIYSETEDPDLQVNETWTSVDGSQPTHTQFSSGTLSPVTTRLPGAPAGSSGGVNSVTSTNDNAPCSIAQGESGVANDYKTGCRPFVGYYPGLPTDPNLVIGYLNKIGLIYLKGSDVNLPGWLNNDLAKTVSDLESSSYLLPGQQAALFQLMAQTPGYHLVPNVTDAIGRSGFGIEWTFEGDAGALIFDPTTFVYLGDRTWPGPAVANAQYDGDALIAKVVVDSSGTRPTGSSGAKVPATGNS